MVGSLQVEPEQCRSALRAPVFWLALAVLCANDHVLKGSAMLPSWLTGKLSDFAGLIVAPVLAAELCRGPLLRLRSIAPSLVVAAFVLTELSPRAASALHDGLAALGLNVRLWADPSDLLALAVLPITVSLVAIDDPRRALVLRERFILALASVACVATTALPMYRYHPFLVNHSGSTFALHARFYSNVSCEQSLSVLASELAAGVEPPEHVQQLALTEVAVLLEPHDESDVSGDSCVDVHEGEIQDDAGLSRVRCVAAEIWSDALAHHLVRAPAVVASELRAGCKSKIPVYDDPGPGALIVAHGSGGEPRLVANDGVELLPLP